MKHVILIILFSVLLLDGYAQGTSAEINKLSWLTGTWNRTNVKAGRTAHERWIKEDHLMQGWGVSMNGSDTTFVEKLKIIEQNKTLYYIADVPENKSSVYFKITEISLSGFVCANPEHDFPKKIAYQLEGTKLKATISGNGKSVDYFFEKQ
jgi:hypothetical protein